MTDDLVPDDFACRGCGERSRAKLLPCEDGIACCSCCVVSPWPEKREQEEVTHAGYVSVEPGSNATRVRDVRRGDKKHRGSNGGICK